MKLPMLARPMRLIDDQTRYYDDKILATDTEVWTAVEVPLKPYAFKAHVDRYMTGWTSTLSLAALREGDFRFKVVRRPFTSSLWVQRTNEAVQEQGHPSGFWAQSLAAQAARMEERQASTKHVILMKRLGSRTSAAQIGARMRRGPVQPLSERELGHWHTEADRARDLLARGAYGAGPVDADMMRYLRRHALSRGLAPPRPTATGRTSWGPTENADEFADIEVTPLAHGVRVDSPLGTVYTATLVAAAFPQDVSFPNIPPWLHHLDRVGQWAEADVVARLVPPSKAKRDVVMRQRLAADQHREAAGAGASLPIEVEQMHALAHELEFSIPARRLPLVYGYVRIHVDAPDEETLAFRVARTIERFADEDSPRLDLTLPGGYAQVDLLTEGIPCWKQRHKSWQQRWMVETVACGLPQAGSNLGHPAGFYAGYTTGRYLQAVSLDLHAAITRKSAADVEGPGGFFLGGNQRAGKSTAMGMVIDNATTVGTPTVVIDFSGPLARLADLPRHTGRIQVLNLLKTGGGVLDPMSPAVIPGDARVNRRVREERKALTRNVLHLMAYRHITSDPDAETAMLEAISEVAVEPHPRLIGVVERLGRMHSNTSAQRLASVLRFALENGDADVLTGEGEVVEYADEPITRIITAPGIALPRTGSSLGEWLPSEALGAAMFTAAAHLGHRLLWELPPHLLKFLLIDEAHIAMGTEAGKRVIELSLRDGPKHGTVVGLATHNARDINDERITNAIANWFIFRSTSEVELGNALAMAHLEDTPLNRDQVRGLRNGECIAVLHDDTRDRMQWDLYDPELAAALRTTPSGVVIP